MFHSDHCPWIANCKSRSLASRISSCWGAGVGFHNQGHFLRFLIYVDLATSYHLSMLVRRVLELTPGFAVRHRL